MTLEDVAHRLVTGGVAQMLQGVCAIRLRCHARIVSGVTIVAASASACLLSCLPISARVFRTPSLSRTRPCIWLRRMRFSVTR